MEADQEEGGDGRNRSQLGLGEVDDAVGPVDEDEAHADQAVEAADDRALHEHASRNRRRLPSHLEEADVQEGHVDASEDGLNGHLDEEDVAERDLEHRAGDGMPEHPAHDLDSSPYAGCPLLDERQHVRASPVSAARARPATCRSRGAARR